MSIEFLVQMAWKSGLISGGALAIAALLRSRSAHERAAVLRAGVALVLILPLLEWTLPALPIEIWAAPEAALIAAAPAEPSLNDPTPLILLVWLGGVAMVVFRLLAGLWTLRRWTRSADEVECPAWRDAFAAVAGGSERMRKVRLLASDAPSPLGWGWRRPVILIDRATIRNSEDARAVLAHELAHVERDDWLVLVMARVAVAVFWFNPLIWLLERRTIDESETAADGRALARVEPARYAQTLLSCARHRPSLLPATGIAEAALARRVRAVLEGKVHEQRGQSRRARLAMLLCFVFAAPVASLKLVAAAPEAAAPQVAPSVAPPASSRLEDGNVEDYEINEDRDVDEYIESRVEREREIPEAMEEAHEDIVERR